MPSSMPPVPLHFVRDRLAWFAYLMLGYYSYLLNGLGPLTPFLRSELGLGYTLASLHFSAFASGLLLAGATTDRVVARIGRRATLWVGAGGLAAGAIALLAGRQPAVTIPAAFVMGVLGSTILVVVPAALSDHYGEQRAVALAEANVMGSAAATLAPFCIGFLARTALGWRAAVVLPILALIPLAIIFRHQSLGGRAPAGGARTASGPLPRAYWVYWIVLVVVVSIEFCIIFWIADFLRSARGLGAADAALSGTLFLGAMLAGRFAGSRLLRHTESFRMLLSALAVTAIGFLLHWQLHSGPAIGVGLAVAGLGVANLYPASLALAVGTAPQQLDKASARASLASGTAILALPLLLGRLADLVGIQQAYGLVGILVLLGFGLVLAARRSAAANAPASKASTAPARPG
jgi:fucose permease